MVGQFCITIVQQSLNQRAAKITRKVIWKVTLNGTQLFSLHMKLECDSLELRSKLVIEIWTEVYGFKWCNCKNEYESNCEVISNTKMTGNNDKIFFICNWPREKVQKSVNWASTMKKCTFNRTSFICVFAEGFSDWMLIGVCWHTLF